MHPVNARIRPYRPADEQALYDICLRTGDSGEDATALYRDPRVLGEVYVGPYLHFPDAVALAGEDHDGVAGYVLGVPDTLAFERWCDREWWPAIRARYPTNAFPADTWDARIVRLIHTPPVTTPDVVERYPAHLHIDLLPRIQGRGDGRRLLTALMDALPAPGIHLGVARTNERAIGFYARMGFTEVAAYTHSFVLARSL